MGRQLDPTSLHTAHMIARAARRAERTILRQSLAEIVPRIHEDVLDITIGLDVGSNGGLRGIEIGDVRYSTIRMNMQAPISRLAPGRLAPLLVGAIEEVLAEVRAAA